MIIKKENTNAFKQIFIMDIMSFMILVCSEKKMWIT